MKIWTSDQVDWILAKYFFAFLSTEKKSRSTKTQIRKANIQQCGKSLARKIDPGEGGGGDTSLSSTDRDALPDGVAFSRLD